jgi:hypothetical protein
VLDWVRFALFPLSVWVSVCFAPNLRMRRCGRDIAGTGWVTRALGCLLLGAWVALSAVTRGASDPLALGVGLGVAVMSYGLAVWFLGPAPRGDEAPSRPRRRRRSRD